MRAKTLIVAILTAISGIAFGCGDDNASPGRATFADTDDIGNGPGGETPDNDVLEITGVEFPTGNEGMRFVPASLGVYGCDHVWDDRCGRTDQEITVVYTNAFWLDEREVSVAEYSACVEAGACDPVADVDADPAPDDPAGGIRSGDAADYCAWLGKRLARDAEWERAARGYEGRKFPWGDAWCPDCCNWCAGAGCADDADGFSGPAPVTAFADVTSPYGIAQMSGNVWEWTIGPDPDELARDIPFIRGGAYAIFPGIGDDSDPPGQYRATRRFPITDGGLDLPTFGIRCAADPVYE